MTIVWWAAGLCLLALGLVITGGLLLPEQHTVRGEADLPVPPQKIWQILTDFKSYPEWRSNVQSIDITTAPGATSFTEHSSQGAIPFAVEQADSERILVTRIADPKLPFGGTWKYELNPINAGTHISITENGRVHNPIFRFLSKFVFGHTKTMNTFLSDLQIRVKKGTS